MLIKYDQTLAFTIQYVSTAFLDTVVMNPLTQRRRLLT